MYPRLKPGVVTLIKDPNGNHVVQRCLPNSSSILGSVPSTITVKLLSKVMDEMAHDISSSAVRCAVVDGMIYLLDNPQSHELLKVLLPKLAPLLDDPVLSVRTAVADLLLTLEEFRAARKLILAWGVFDDILKTLSKLLHNASNIAGSSNIASEMNRSKQDRSRQISRENSFKTAETTKVNSLPSHSVAGLRSGVPLKASSKSNVVDENSNVASPRTGIVKSRPFSPRNSSSPITDSIDPPVNRSEAAQRLAVAVVLDNCQEQRET